jgi:hypothetical protein
MTSGAVVAYVLGLCMYLSWSLPRRARLIAFSIGGLAVLLTGIVICVVDEKVLPDTRLTNQIFLMRSKVGQVLQGEDIQYYQFEKAMGSGSGSALWRIQHWRDIVVAYSKGTPMEQIFGFGPGSSVAVVEILPHNEYLRMLFEEGLVGLALFLFAWFGIVKTAPPGIRYVALIIAVYSFSENNLDNFPFMALLVLCLSANGTTAIRSSARVRRPIYSHSLSSSAVTAADVKRPQILQLSQ